MPDLAHIGDFCPNEACPDQGKLQVDQSKRNIEKAGKTKKGKQRAPVTIILARSPQSHDLRITKTLSEKYESKHKQEDCKTP